MTALETPMFVRATALLLAACTASPALASIVTFRFDGIVTTGAFTSGRWAGADAGDSFAVQFTFDTDSPDSDPAPTLGDYRTAISTYTIIAGTAFETGPGGTIEVRNDTLDGYRVRLELEGDFFAEINLVSLDDGPFADDALPIDMTITDWATRQFSILPNDGPGSVVGTITSFTLVPAPGAIALFGAAIFGASRRRR
jgi:hypothetical protein